MHQIDVRLIRIMPTPAYRGRISTQDLPPYELPREPARLERRCRHAGVAQLTRPFAPLRHVFFFFASCCHDLGRRWSAWRFCVDRCSARRQCRSPTDAAASAHPPYHGLASYGTSLNRRLSPGWRARLSPATILLQLARAPTLRRPPVGSSPAKFVPAGLRSLANPARARQALPGLPLSPAICSPSPTSAHRIKAPAGHSSRPRQRHVSQLPTYPTVPLK